MNKKINTALAISVIIIIAVITGAIIWNNAKSEIGTNQVQVEKIVANSKTDAKNDKTPKIGEECNFSANYLYNDEIKENTQGLQCYYYNDVKNATDTTKPRKGVWIYPDERSILYVDYFKYIKNFEKFSNDIISFSYPAESRLDNWWSQDQRISLTMGNPENNPSAVNIEQQEGVFDLDNFLVNIKKNHSKVFFDAQNQSVINSITTDDYRIDAMATTNITNDDVYFVFPRGDKYILVSAQRTGDPYSDFLTEAFLQSIKIK